MIRILLTLILYFTAFSALNAKDTVVLLHGLARSSCSMNEIACELEKENYHVLNLEYPSRKHTIEQLSKFVREKIVCDLEDAERIHFVTHSMGGILVRYMQQHFPIDNIGRVVMLSPPNQGSEVVDKLGCFRVFEWINGPAGQQLGTSEGSLISELGPVDFELGIITGDRSINWILSCMIPGSDDGKVSVKSAQVNGMKDFKIIHATHPFIMKHKKAVRHIRGFLRDGKFEQN